MKPGSIPGLRLCTAPALAFALVAGAAGAEGCVIAIDIGHTTGSPGAISARGIPEFQFNLALSRALRAALTARGCEVTLINEAGDLAALAQRTAQARGAHLFLSVHHDSVQPQYLRSWEFDGAQQRFSDRFSGYSLFVSRANPFPEKSLHCASTIGSLLQTHGHMPSAHHAENIAGENRAFADRANGVHYHDELVVLRTAGQAAVLVEAGVIVNRASEQALGMQHTRLGMAEAIARAVTDCLDYRPATQ